MEPMFSFIVPIYNAEKYLAQCLSSIQEQTFNDFEVWMIDDGSTDGSPQIAESYAKRDARFHYFRQDNQGTSGATNAGLLRAKGEYLINLDNDDYIDRSLLAVSKETIEKLGPDIIQFQSVFVDENGRERQRQYFLGEAMAFSGFLNVAKCEQIMPGAFNRTHSRKVFRRQLLEGILFEGTSKGADTSFLRRVLFRTEKVILRPEHMFFVREIQASESRKPNPPYLYKEWFDRELRDIDFCIKENGRLKRPLPFWVFSDLIDMWQLFAAKAINESAFDKTYFRDMGKEFLIRKRYLANRDIRSSIRWRLWFKHTGLLAKRMAAKLPREDFIV